MGESRKPVASPMVNPARMVREFFVLFKAGMLRPAMPGKVVRQLTRLAQYGPTLSGAFTVAAARSPRKVAVVDDRVSRTYAELDERVRAVVRGLTARGIQAEDTLAILGRNSVAFVESLVSISRLGSDALLLNTFMSPQQVRDVLEREKPKVVFADPDLLPLLDDAPEGILIVAMQRSQTWRTGDVVLEDLMIGGPDPKPSRRRGRLVVLTSGTTGVPKGARRPAPGGLSPAASMLSRLPINLNDTVLIASPLFHTWGLGILQILPGLAATIVLRERADPENLLAAVAKTPCTVLVAVPVILERMLHLPAETRAQYDTSRLRMVAASGSALTTDVAERFQDVFGDVLYNIYGSTEISWATIANPSELRAAPGTAGRPPLGTTLKIINDDGEPVPQGEIGRIFVGNELLFEGYTNGADKERIGHLMATGDLGYLNPSGLLMVAGRDDDLIISGAEKIYPAEVEAVIQRLPGVREVAVVGRPDDEMGQRLVAFVVRHEGAAVTGAQVQDHVRAHLARYAVPKAVGFVAELPRTPTGKVVPRLLPDSALRSGAPAPDAASEHAG